MTISEMHSMFRTLGQQKGMQHVRAILPAEIDDYLNAAIIEKCRAILGTNVSTVFNDKLSVRDNPVSPINALRTLYKEFETTISGTKIGDYYQIAETISPMVYTSFIVEYIGENNSIEKACPCRFVENDKVRFLTSDYCNAPSDDYPIVTLVIPNGVTARNYRVFIGDATKTFKLKGYYVAMPTKVNNANSVNCDLPDYLHQEIVEQAVQKFFISIGATSHQVKQ